MAINKKLIHFNKKESFDRELANQNILNNSICFIQDTKEIYTHGQFYNCNCSEHFQMIENLRKDFDDLVGGNTSEAITSFNEVIAFLEGIEDSENLDNIIASIQQQIAAIKIPTKVSELNNDSNYSTSLATLKLVYPVGSVYISTSSTNPSSLFGFGTWEQIKDTFLLAAGSTYTAGSTGGEASHKLTSSEMPSHTHTIGKENNCIMPNQDPGQNYGVAYLTSTDFKDLGQGVGSKNTNGKPFVSATNDTMSHTHTANSTGGNTAHNNMPPYLTVYMFKRTK